MEVKVSRTPRKRKKEYKFTFSLGSTQEEVLVTFDSKGERPYPSKCVLRDPTGREKLVSPKKLIKALKESKKVLISSDERTSSDADEVKSFLRNFQIKFEEVTFCTSCLQKGEYKTETSYFFEGKPVCMKCAIEELKRLLKERIGDFPDFILEKAIKKNKEVRKAFLELVEISEPNEITVFRTIQEKKPKKLDRIEVSSLKIPNKIKESLIRWGINELNEMQTKALNSGLLEGRNLLVVSPTGSGKTLIAEIPGVTRALNGEKFIYLTPLVALANQKYEEFKDKYPFLKVGIRVGVDRLKTKEYVEIRDTSIDCHVIVGTYEGIDYLLRKGREIGPIGVVAIDEVHNLGDEERGWRIRGLIERLKRKYDPQFIFLSATVGNPEELSEELGATLVLDEERPVPIEIHVIPVSGKRKIGLISKLVERESREISTKGYRGKTIVFTNSRRKVEEISQKIMALPYHSGMPYSKRRAMELAFNRGKAKAIVTTAALGSGVDFPASQVIFESLTMGNKWLTKAEFYQMLGRAGRPSYHDRGRVVILLDPKGSFMGSSEKEVLEELLSPGVDRIEPNPIISVDFKKESEEILAFLSSGITKSYEDLIEIHRELEFPSTLGKILSFLLEDDLVRYSNGEIKVTRYGKAVSESFIDPVTSREIKRRILSSRRGRCDKCDPLEMAIELKPFTNAYLGEDIYSEIKDKVSVRLFSGTTLEFLSRPRGVNKGTLRKISRLVQKYLSCNCKDSPFCGCGELKLSMEIVRKRIDDKLDPSQISKEFEEDGLLLYSGDVFNWLEEILHLLHGIERISEALGEIKYSKITREIRKRIEDPWG